MKVTPALDEPRKALEGFITGGNSAQCAHAPEDVPGGTEVEMEHRNTGGICILVLFSSWGPGAQTQGAECGAVIPLPLGHTLNPLYYFNKRFKGRKGNRKDGNRLDGP